MENKKINYVCRDMGKMIPESKLAEAREDLAGDEFILSFDMETNTWTRIDRIPDWERDASSDELWEARNDPNY